MVSYFNIHVLPVSVLKVGECEVERMLSACTWTPSAFQTVRCDWAIGTPASFYCTWKYT